jgi:hypothetical protein
MQSVATQTNKATVDISLYRFKWRRTALSRQGALTKPSISVSKQPKGRQRHTLMGSGTGYPATFTAAKRATKKSVTKPGVNMSGESIEQKLRLKLSRKKWLEGRPAACTNELEKDL